MNYYGSKELAESFRTVRKNTLIIAEEIPEEKYSFRATPDTRSVAEMLAHVAASTNGAYELHAQQRIMTYVGFDFLAFTQRRTDAERTLQTKTQILTALRESGERWASWLEGLSENILAEVVTMAPQLTPPAKSRFELILSAKEHEMHHRAQLMLIERMLGIVPHLTRQREAMRAQMQPR